MNESIEIDTTKRTIFAIAITEDTRERLRKLARKNGVSMAQIVKTAVDDYLRARKIE